MARHAFAKRSKGRLLTTAAAFTLFMGGGGLVGVWLSSQQTAAALPMSGVEGSENEGVLGATEPMLRTTIPIPEEAIRTAARSPMTRSNPVALDIPSIGVHSVVQYVGQAADGSIAAPAPGPHYNEAAWYKYSPTPGALGPAVILGHVDSAAEGPSVFFRLGELRPGDRVSVDRADGSTAVFVVDDVSRYPKNNFPTRLVYGDIDHAGLRILTCGGAFDDSTGHYEDNIVVFASLASSHSS
jgi:hypothetical protein